MLDLLGFLRIRGTDVISIDVFDVYQKKWKTVKTINLNDVPSMEDRYEKIRQAIKEILDKSLEKFMSEMG